MLLLKKLKHTISYALIRSLFFILGQQNASMRAFNAKLLANILYGLPKLFKRRVHIIEKNLQHCFAEQFKNNPQQLKQATKRNIWHSMRSILERAWLWTKPAKALQEIDIEGYEYIDWQTPAIFVGVHNCGLELAPQALIFQSFKLQHSTTEQWASVFMDTKPSAMRDFIYESRKKISNQLIAKQDGVKPIVKHFKDQQKLGKAAFFNLFCDMDFGLQNSLFVPFFEKNACTSTSLPRLVHVLRQQLKSKVALYSVHAIYDLNSKRYKVYISRPWQNFAENTEGAYEVDLYNNLKTFNQFIESVVLQDIEQYWWLHRRFKTQVNDRKIY